MAFLSKLAFFFIMETGSVTFLCIIFGIEGFFLLPTFPIIYELGVELVFPIGKIYIIYFRFGFLPNSF